MLWGNVGSWWCFLEKKKKNQDLPARCGAYGQTGSEVIFQKRYWWWHLRFKRECCTVICVSWWTVTLRACLILLAGFDCILEIWKVSAGSREQLDKCSTFWTPRQFWWDKLWLLIPVRGEDINLFKVNKKHMISIENPTFWITNKSQPHATS